MAVAAAAGGSTILKRVAFLNRSGILAKPLRYSEVKGSLEALSTEDALKLLQDLEEQAAATPDPVAFIKDGALTPGGGKKRKADSLDGDEASALANSTGIIAKRIKHLNSAGRITRPIVYTRVREALESLDVGQAMVILTGLEDVAGKVRDPTGYIRAAVRAAGGNVPADPTAPEEEEEEAEITAEPVEAPEEDAMDDEEEPAAPATPPKRPAKIEFSKKMGVKSELGKGKGKGKYGGGGWGKGEDLSDEEKIGRRIAWLNENLGFASPVEISEVMIALDSIGLRQSMRVLRRLEESAGDVPDPNEFIKDLVARSGWIWAKPDVIDDDEKVAKRVSWLNQFGGLQAPIDYVEVADILDGLKVPHAMVLLRELEINAYSVEDPTEYIRKTVALAGEDDVQIPAVEAGGEDTAIGQRIAWLNANASLVAPIEFGEVMSGLNRIGDTQAMGLLQEVEDKGPSVKDPTGFLKFKLKAKLASMGFTLEETRDTETEILKRIEWLNDYGGLSADIDYNVVAAPLEALGIEQAMTVLKELEDKKQTVRDPTTFIRQSISLSSKKPARPAVGPTPPTSKPAQAATAGSGADFRTLSGFVGILSKKSRKPIKFSDIAAALDTLGPRATVIMKEMQEKGLGLDDPVQYINAAAFRAERDQAKYQRGGDEDDVQKLTRKLNWLNQFGGLAETIKLEEVVGALYCLGIPQSMAILKGLQEKGSKVKDPTWYIKAAVQRANGVTATKLGVKAELGVKGEDEDEEFEEEYDAAMGEEDAEAEDAAEADEYPEVEGDGLNEGEADDEDYVAGVTAEMEAANAEARQELEEMGDEAWIDDAIPAAKVPMFKKGAAKPKAPSRPQVQAMMQEKDHRTAYFPATAPTEEPGTTTTKRVVGTVTGFNKLIPHEAKKERKLPPKPVDYAEQDTSAPRIQLSAGTAALPITPQEKMAQVRNLAVKVGLSFDDQALKALARLPFYRAKDLIDEVLLGGKNRRGVRNPSRYVCLGVQRMSLGLGVEQGIAMELAVSVGVVLNNEALDELASIPRKDSHMLIREIAKSEEAKADPIGFIRQEVRKAREAADARPFPFPSMG